MNKEQRISLSLHFIAWLIFISLPLLILPHASDQMSKHTFQFILTNVLLILFYYTNAYYFVPRYLSQKRLSKYIGIVILFLALYLYLPFIYSELPPVRGRYLKNLSNLELFYFRHIVIRMNSIVLFLLVFAMSTGSRLLSELFETRNRKKELEFEKSKAELALLRSQTDPHFFFNVLNSLYYLSIKQSDKTPDAIIKLSDIMRYVLTESTKDFVPLANEINYIRQYISLQEMRLPEKTSVNLEIEGELSNKYIAPLIFITYIENAFKHGVSSQEATKIDIKISVTNSFVQLQVSNIKFIHETSKESGIGLENAQKRLNLIYPEKHYLSVSDKNNLYTVSLKIQL